VIPPSFAHAKPFMDQGAPVAVSFPHLNSEVPPIGPLSSWAITAQAPHPNAAKVFMAWFLSEAAQKIGCEISGDASALLISYDKCPKPSDHFLPAERNLSQERIDELLRRLGLQ